MRLEGWSRMRSGPHGSRRAFRAPHHEELRSSHLALHLRGIFGIDLADHPVAAIALGCVEAGVGALDQRIGVVALRALLVSRMSRVDFINDSTIALI